MAMGDGQDEGLTAAVGFTSSDDDIDYLGAMVAARAAEQERHLAANRPTNLHEEGKQHQSKNHKEQKKKN